MKKLFFFLMLALGLSATTIKAQNDSRVSMNTTTGKQTQGATFGEKVNAGLSSSSVSSSSRSVTIWFGKSGCRAGFGICRIDLDLKNAMSRMDDNQLKGTYTKNADGTATLELDGNSNRAFVDKLLANGKMELDQDYTFAPEVAKQLFGTETMSLRQGGWNLKENVKRGDNNARMMGGNITIVIGKLVITIKW